MTEILYYDDPTVLEFTARVTGVHPAEGGADLLLDRTAFYPEGGGQPSDRGTIGALPVAQVRMERSTVVHRVLSSAVDSLPAPGTEVTGVVDGERRRDYAQQHTGQHVISAALVSCGGHGTVSVHQGEDYTTIEIDSDRLSEAELRAAEEQANRVVEEDVPVETFWISAEEIGRYPLRRPPKVSGRIRLVRIGLVDCVACGGLHVDRTGRIRLVRVVGRETIRGRARIAWKIGDRAIDDYRVVSDVAGRLGALLSAPPGALVERVESQEARIRDGELEARRLRQRVWRLEADRLLAKGVPPGPVALVTAGFEGEDADFLRGVTEALLARSAPACLVSLTGDRLCWSVGLTPDCGIAFDTVRRELLPLIAGRGGGRPPVWQGVGDDAEGADRFLAAFAGLVKRGD